MKCFYDEYYKDGKDCDMNFNCDDCQIHKDIKLLIQTTYKHWVSTGEMVDIDEITMKKIFDKCK